VNDLAFIGMSFVFRVRDAIKPRIDILREAGLAKGQSVLDFGCGPGSYIAGTAELVGASGAVYALDRHPRAIDRVQNLSRKLGLGNVRTILADSETGLPDESMDAVLLYDVLHMFDHPDSVLTELARVLKGSGKLSCHDHHMRDEDCVNVVTGSGLFSLAGRGSSTYTYLKRSNR